MKLLFSQIEEKCQKKEIDLRPQTLNRLHQILNAVYGRTPVPGNSVSWQKPCAHDYNYWHIHGAAREMRNWAREMSVGFGWVGGGEKEEGVKPPVWSRVGAL
jgi:hypothetical protein